MKGYVAKLAGFCESYVRLPIKMFRLAIFRFLFVALRALQQATILRETEKRREEMGKEKRACAWQEGFP